MHRISSRRRFAGESGFTVIEASVAMLLAALMFTALSAGLISGLRATRDARLYQQATSIGEEAVEGARDLQYDTLVMVTSDLSGDPRIQPDMTFDPPGDPGPEPVVASGSGGSIDDHIINCPADPQPVCNQSFGNTPFTISRYVTWVDDNPADGIPAQSYKRMLVIIEWQIGSRTNSYVTSSFIALARRGLPVPKFELAPEAQTVEVEQGNLVVFPHTISNLGIVDTYDLEMPNDRGWVISFYRDEGQIGTFEPVVDTLLFDTNSTGVPDTGSVGTDEVTYFLAVFFLSPAEIPDTVELTLTATSGANDSVSHDAKDTLIVGFAGLTLNLHNKPTPPTGDTTAQMNMAMNLSPVTDIPQIHKYSTNYYPIPVVPDKPGGRYIKNKNASDSETSTEFMANWVYQLPAQATFNGTVELKLWVARKDFSCTGGPVQIRAYLRKKTLEDDSGVETSLANGSSVMVPTEVGSCPFQQITLTMALTNVTIPISQFLELKVTNRNASGDAALIAYDTETYRSTIKLPQVSSG